MRLFRHWKKIDYYQFFLICWLTHTLRTNSIENWNVIKTSVCFTIVLNEISCVLCDLFNLDFCITRYNILIYIVCAYIIRRHTYVIKCVKYLNYKRFTYNYSWVYHISHCPPPLINTGRGRNFKFLYVIRVLAVVLINQFWVKHKIRIILILNFPD